MAQSPSRRHTKSRGARTLPFEEEYALLKRNALQGGVLGYAQDRARHPRSKTTDAPRIPAKGDRVLKRLMHDEFLHTNDMIPRQRRASKPTSSQGTGESYQLPRKTGKKDYTGGRGNWLDKINADLDYDEEQRKHSRTWKLR